MSLRRRQVPIGAALLGLVAAAALDGPSRLGLAVATEPMLALALALSALVVSSGGAGGAAERARVRPLLLAAAAVLSAPAVLAASAQAALADPAPWAVGAAVAVLVALGLAVHALFGPVLPVGAAALALFVALLAPALPAAWRLAPVDAPRLAVFLVFDGNALLGRLLELALHTIAPFVLLGVALKDLGGVRGLVAAVAGRLQALPGGAAKAAILASATFGTLSGSAVANVATVGSVTIPAMVRAGQSPEEAAGIEAAASTGGQLMPPMLGATAFLMADSLGVPYARVAAASVVPALLYFGALFLAVDLASRRRAAERIAAGGTASFRGLPRRGAETAGAAGSVLVLLWLLFAGTASPGQAALVATVPVLAGAIIARPRRAGRRLARLAAEAATAVAGLLLLAAASAVLLGLLAVNGLGSLLSLRLVALAGHGAVGLLVASAALAVLLGLGVPTLGVYVLMAGIAAPALAESGVAPLAAHLFLTWFGVLAMITPPVALAAYAAAAIAGCSAWRAAVATLPLWPGLVVPPFAFALAPALLEPTAPAPLLAALGPTVLALALVTAAAVGQAGAALGGAERLAAALAGIACLAALSPGLPAPVPTGLVGAGAACAVALFRRRRAGLLAGADLARRPP